MPPTANDQFRQARERAESRSRPGEHLSRQELAELHNDYVLKHFGEEARADADYIGKLELGVIRWPRERSRAAFRELLGVSGDETLGFYHHRASVTKVEAVNRQAFFGGITDGPGVLGVAPLAAQLTDSAPTPIPTRVGQSEIDHVYATAEVFTTWDHSYGGGSVREAVLAQLRWSARLLDARCPARLRGELLRSIGFLAHTCGFMAFDMEIHGDALRAFRLAVACADGADDRNLRAMALSSMARQSIWTGHPDDGLTTAEQALVRADRLTATEQAMLHTARSRALARLGRVAESLASMSTADDCFADADRGNDPPWMAHYDHAHHQGDTGHALYDLALRTSNGDHAARRLADAVAGFVSGAVRARVMCGIKLSSLLMAVGSDPVDAAAIGTAALDEAGRLQSARVLSDLTQLNKHAAPHRKIDEVAALSKRITAMVRAS